MGKALAFLAIVAAALAALAVLVVQQPIHYSGVAGAGRAAAANLSVPYSFAAGFVVGATLMWMFGRRRLAIARARLGWKLSWGRRLALLGLAALAIGLWLHQ
jgi:hypothetical protein